MALLSAVHILAAFLIFVRVSGMIMTAPFFSSASFPVQVKLFFAVITSLLLSFVIPAGKVLIPLQAGLPFLVTAIIMELLVGVALGLVGQLVFAGVEMAGRLISLKITLSFAQIIDSLTQQRSDIVGNIFNMLAILVFLTIGGDKIYLTALAKSFEVIPVNQAQISQIGPYMLQAANYLFVIGVQLASPFLIVLFLLDLSLAIFARIMPQANIMFIAIPVKLGLGFILLMLVTPYLPDAFRMMFGHLFDYLRQLLSVMAPS